MTPDEMLKEIFGDVTDKAPEPTTPLSQEDKDRQARIDAAVAAERQALLDLEAKDLAAGRVPMPPI